MARFSRDGSRVAAVDLRGSLTLWDTADGRRLASLGGERENVVAWLFSGDGTRLTASASIPEAADVILVQDAISGGPVSRISLPRGYLASGAIVAISHDGAMVATGSRQGLLDLWDTATGTRLGRLADDRLAVESIAFSPDGSRLASGSPSGRIMIWDVATRSRLRDLVGHDGIVPSLAFHPEGSRLASACLDGTVRLWQLDGPRRLSTLDLASPLTAAAFSPDGSLVAIAGEAAPQVEVWRVDAVERLAVLTGTDGRVADIAWSPDGRMVAAAFSTPGHVGEARLWRIDAAGAGTSLPGHASGAVSVAFTPDRSRMVTAAADGLAMAWDTTTGRRLWVAAEPQRMRIERLPAVVVGGGRGVSHGSVHVLDAETGGVLTTLRPRGRVICLAADATGSQLAMGMAIGTAYVVATSDGAARARLAGHDDAVCAVAFSPDGRRLATGSLDGTARLWHTDGDTIEQACLSGHGGAVEGVAFSPDGSRLLTATADGTVRLWDAALGRLLCVLPAARGAAGAAAISPDGRFVLAGSESGGVRLWGLTNAAVAAARRQSPAGFVVGRPGESSLPGGLLEGGKEGSEVGEILTVEAEGPQVR
jgi:WD40 repeat protein